MARILPRVSHAKRDRPVSSLASLAEKKYPEIYIDGMGSEQLSGTLSDEISRHRHRYVSSVSGIYDFFLSSRLSIEFKILPDLS